MKFVLPFTGSRGDVQPGLALGIELARRGHDVTFGAPPNLLSFARIAASTAPRLSVVPFGPDTKALLESNLVRTRIKSRNPRVRIAALAELANYGWDDMTDRLVEIAQGADAAVTGTLGQEMTFNLAEAQQIPFVALHYCPIRSNSSMSVVPGTRLPGPVNRGTWKLLETMRWRSMRGRENAQRARLGSAATTSALPQRIADYDAVEIQAYDADFFPGLADEWGPGRPFTGFLELPRLEIPRAGTSFGTSLEPGSPLRSWIDDGAPPLYFGFGSMPVVDPHRLVEMIDDVCATVGHRALVTAGWSAIEERIDLGARVAVTGPVDHAEVFPLCRAAIHHGGAGTTAASIRAGLPTMVCWFSADQPFWGAALRRTGAGTSAKFTTLDTATLTDGVRTLLRPETKAAAHELAETMTPADESLATAASIVERSVTRSGR